MYYRDKPGRKTGVRSLNDAISVSGNQVRLGKASAGTVEILDAQGKAFRSTAASGSAPMDFSRLRTGVYFVRVTADDHEYTRPLVKAR